jgi:hypothetical protein
MLVPKTAVNKNNSLVFREDKVWNSWQILAMKLVPESFCVDVTPYD